MFPENKGATSGLRRSSRDAQYLGKLVATQPNYDTHLKNAPAVLQP